MSEIKISEMLEAEEVNDEDLIMIIQNGVNKKVRAEKVGIGNDGGDSEELGSVKLWFSNTIPQNWLLLNGQAISRTEYSELFTILGTTYGVGDGSTTFNLPDMRDRVAAGLDTNDDTFNVLGKKVGEKKHQLTVAELPSHRFMLNVKRAGSGTNEKEQWGVDTQMKSNMGDDFTEYIGNDTPHNIIQPSLVCNFIIKAKKEQTVQKDLTLSEVVEEVIKQENEEATETNVYSAKAIDKMQVYSTEETDTGKIWIDGKKIYRKVINITTTISDGSTYNHDIQNLDKILEINGVAKTGDNVFIPLIHCIENIDGTGFSSVVTVEENKIRFYLSTLRSQLLEAVVILEYTKITD